MIQSSSTFKKINLSKKKRDIYRFFQIGVQEIEGIVKICLRKHPTGQNDILLCLIKYSIVIIVCIHNNKEKWQ